MKVSAADICPVSTGDIWPGGWEGRVKERGGGGPAAQWGGSTGGGQEQEMISYDSDPQGVGGFAVKYELALMSTVYL